MSAQKIRSAAVAGFFYPASPITLRRAVEEFLAEVPIEAVHRQACPRALIVPHAGYAYSGSIAAHAYAQLLSFRDKIKSVLVLGPSHRVYIRGLALPESDFFETPLGLMEVDGDLRTKISQLDGVEVRDDAHAHEHSLEVQLPFLKIALPEAKLLPIVAGLAYPEVVHLALARALEERGTLLVISSDLSHYLSYEESQRRDQSTIGKILSLETPIAAESACGAVGITGLLELARKNHWKGVLLDLRNSGDTSGDRDRVVGYSSVAFYD